MPAGTVTFLLTDIDGLTQLWERAAGAMPGAVARQYEILDEAIAAHSGVRPVEQGEDDSVVGAFSRAGDALAAAVAAQRMLVAESWPAGVELRVRMALHTGDAQLRDEGNYFGATVIRCARLRSAAHGGQVLLSQATYHLVCDRLPENVELVDLGAHRLRDLGRTEHLWALAHPELPVIDAPPRSLDALANNLPVELSSFVGRERESGRCCAGSAFSLEGARSTPRSGCAPATTSAATRSSICSARWLTGRWSRSMSARD